MIIPPIQNTVPDQPSEPSQAVVNNSPPGQSLVPQPLIPDLLGGPVSMPSPPILLQAREVLAKPTQLVMKVIESFGQPVSSFPTEQAKDSALKAAVYAISAFIMPDSGEQEVNKRLATLDTDSEREVFTVFMATRITTEEGLVAQFSKLDLTIAREALTLAQNANVHLHKDAETGELSFVAKGTSNWGDVKQDFASIAGKVGEKYEVLESLVQLLKENSASEQEYPQHFIGASLGGGLALAAQKGFGQANSDAMVYDAQPLNKNQVRRFEALAERKIDSSQVQNFRVSSPASLGAILSSKSMFERVPTFLSPNTEHKTNPVSELLDNHNTVGIIRELKKLPVVSAE